MKKILSQTIFILSFFDCCYLALCVELCECWSVLVVECTEGVAQVLELSTRLELQHCGDNWYYIWIRSHLLPRVVSVLIADLVHGVSFA